MPTKSNIFAKPLLLIIALMMVLGMLRLGVWQLNRAEQKQVLFDAQILQTQLPPIQLSHDSLALNKGDRYRYAQVHGRYLPSKTIFLDNQVHQSKVGYHVVSPLQIAGSERVILVNRGWVPVGESREVLPHVMVNLGEVELNGRLNKPLAAPPLWNEGYAVNTGSVWQYLPIAQYASQMQLQTMPLVLELAPHEAGQVVDHGELIREWSKLDNRAVGRHKAYALQWFTMAFVFFVLCFLMLLRSIKNTKSVL